jgi:hypothetical protein
VDVEAVASVNDRNGRAFIHYVCGNKHCETKNEGITVKDVHFAAGFGEGVDEFPGMNTNHRGAEKQRVIHISLNNV